LLFGEGGHFRSSIILDSWKVRMNMFVAMLATQQTTTISAPLLTRPP
jgi:hypothetical protein